MNRNVSPRRSFLATIRSWFVDAPPAAARAKSGGSRGRRLRFETFEERRVMDGAVSGYVYRDLNNNGSYEAGESGIQAAQMQLYRDTGNGAFNAAQDALVSTVSSNATGNYTFATVPLGNYFVVRPAQTIASGPQAGIKLTQKVSSLTALSELKTVIDDFDAPLSQSPAIDATNDNIPTTSIAAGLNSTKVIGGEREIITNFNGTASGPGLQLSGRVGTITIGGNQSGLLLLEATSSARGTYSLVYDGTDGTATTAPNFGVGLGNRDLTAGGATALRTKLNSLDLNGASIKVTVYSSATSYSTASLPLLGQVIDGVAQAGGKTDYEFRFDGIGAGGFFRGVGAASTADFKSVNAIVVTIDASGSDIDARLDMLGAYGNASARIDSAIDEVDVSLVKLVDNATPQVGSLVNWTVTVSNAVTLPNGKNTITATGVNVVDSIFTGADKGRLAFVSDTGGGAFNSASGVWTVGSLTPGQSKTIRLTMRVLDAARPSLTNTASVTSVEQPDPDTDDWVDRKTITPRFVDMGVTKTVNKAQPNKGETIRWTIVATNNGNAVANQITYNDALNAASMAGFQFSTFSSTAGGTFNSGTGVWTIPTLAPNASATLTIDGVINAPSLKTNVVTLAGLGDGAIDTNPNNNRAEASVTPKVTDLGITKTIINTNGLPPNVTPSKASPLVMYSLTVKNNGPSDAVSAQVTDRLPAGLTYVSSDSSAYNPSTGLWDLGPLANGASRSLVITARLNDGAPAVAIRNDAEITSFGQFDSNPNNNKDFKIVTPQVIDLSVTKTIDKATANVGESVNFVIRVTNSGPSAATGVKLSDALPSGLEYITHATPFGNFAPGTGVWTIGSLAVGETVDLNLAAKLIGSVTQTNTAQISAADQYDIDSTPANNIASEDDQASASVTPPVIDLNVTKRVDNATPIVGSNVNWVITVTNSGPSIASGVVLRDALPFGVTYLSNSTTRGTYDPASTLWTIGTLGVNETVTFIVTTRVNVSGVQTNTAEIWAADQFDIDSTPKNGLIEYDLASAEITSTIFVPPPPPPPDPPPPIDPPIFSKRRFLAR